MTTPVRWDPWDELAGIERQIERVFRDAFGSLQRLAPVLPTRPREWAPACDVLTRGEDLVIRLELPGVDPEKEVEIAVEDGMLLVRGERRFEDEERGEDYLRREVARGTFERAISPAAKPTTTRMSVSGNSSRAAPRRRETRRL